jgi:hypothetical protein
MLHKNSADKFSFEDCKFTVQRSKESTGKKGIGADGEREMEGKRGGGKERGREREREGKREGGKERGRERESVTWRGIDDIDRSIRKW